MSAVARLTDPDTSHAAAASVRDIRQSQYAVLRLLRKKPTYGYTDEELVASYEILQSRILSYPFQSASGIRTRRNELVRLGLVEFAGFKRVMTTGREARVWRVVRK